MVRRRVNGSNAVSASGDTTCDGDESWLPFEKGSFKPLKNVNFVLSRGVVEPRDGERLYDNVRVTNDVACRVDRLRGREVVGLRVHERTRLELVDRDGDREVLVRGGWYQSSVGS